MLGSIGLQVVEVWRWIWGPRLGKPLAAAATAAAEVGLTGLPMEEQPVPKYVGLVVEVTMLFPVGLEMEEGGFGELEERALAKAEEATELHSAGLALGI